MKNTKKIILWIIYFALGATLLILGFIETVDEFWSGMGGGLMGVGAVRLIQHCRLKKDDAYRERVETELSDERNAFIRNRAWAWSGYFFIIIAGIAVIVLKILGYSAYSYIASIALCLMLLLYWISFLILKRKY